MTATGLATFQKLAAATVVGLYADTIYVGGVPHTAAVILGRHTIETSSGGLVEKRMLTAQVIKTDGMGTPPGIGDIVRHNLVDYEVDEVSGHRPACPSWTFRAVEADR